jgi:hypothetical protein
MHYDALRRGSPDFFARLQKMSRAERKKILLETPVVPMESREQTCFASRRKSTMKTLAEAGIVDGMQIERGRIGRRRYRMNNRG